MAARFLPLLAIVGILALPSLPAVAADAMNESVESADVRSRIRVEQCDRFADGDDYTRCVRLIRRLPGGSDVRDVESESAENVKDAPSIDWKWENILNQIERKLTPPIKFAGTMAKRFCRDRTDESLATVQECMTRVRDAMKTRVDRLIDAAFRSDSHE